MAKKINFLLGYGERLTQPVDVPRGGGKKAHPYTFRQARERLTQQVFKAVRELDSLPPLACPDDHGTVAMSVHPAYLAKSYYPGGLFQALGVDTLGSRQKQILLTEHGKKRLTATAEFFVAGRRKRFREWAQELGSWTEYTRGAVDLQKIETIELPDRRVRPVRSEDAIPLLEIVLHASEDRDSAFILQGFRDYMESLDIKVDMKKRRHIGGLCFIPVRVPRSLIEEVAKFSYLRVLREMPMLRSADLALKSVAGFQPFTCQLPADGPLNPTIKVAVFDGGLPVRPDLKSWVDHEDVHQINAPVASYQQHGLAVTSALLFGSIKSGQIVSRPFAKVDHFRVLDNETASDPQGELYDVLARIEKVLTQRGYDFVDICIGPDLPIEDDDVNAWTATLDKILSSGRTLATIAVGNGGERDHILKFDRIQVPSDCVNALSIGACDSEHFMWQRAIYSSIGPGRTPGYVKPDGVAFGGSDNNPYWVLGENGGGYLVPTAGTSFAAPTALRAAIGVRAYLGNSINALAIKALMLNRCERGDKDPIEVGWGRIQTSAEDLITCDSHTAHIVYQGDLYPSQWIRAKIPLPKAPLVGKVTISATICYSTETDPQDAVHYTRSGLDVIFRPDRSRREPDSSVSKSEPFFRTSNRYPREDELRREAFKWETVLSGRKTISGDRLNDPAFDIYYNARKGGAPYKDANKIPYALIVSIYAPKIPDLYDRILSRYRTRLQPLRPIVQIPIRTKI